jgi:hypothetical protein
MMRKQDNFLENILWLKRRQNYGAKNVVIKRNTVLYCFADLGTLGTSLGRGFDRAGDFCGWFLVLQSENVSSKMKNAIIWFNSYFVSRSLGQKEWIIWIRAVVSGLKQFKS